MTGESKNLVPPNTHPGGSKTFEIPSLDGIRAVAFILVFLAHAGMGNLLPGGFGVTIFFFLSGYLITSLLRREYEQDRHISLKNFYLRRILRIFPPMYLTLALALGAWAIGLAPGDVRLPGVLAQVFHLTNYYEVFVGQHFVIGTGVYWSLAVEEHFYLTFPLLFLLVVRYGSFHRLAMILVGICAAVLIWRCFLIYGWHVPPDRCYLASDTRFDSIAFGCIMALYQNPYMDPVRLQRQSSKILLLILGVSLLLVSFVFRDPGFRETFRYSIQGVALFPLFYLAISNPRWPIFAWLNLALVRFLGTLSYTLYLSHHVVIVALSFHWSAPVWLKSIVAFIISFIYAVVVYYLIERPCARLRKRLHQSPANVPLPVKSSP